MLPAYNIYAGLDYFFDQSGNLRDTVSFAVFRIPDYCFKNLSLLKNIAPPLLPRRHSRAFNTSSPITLSQKKEGDHEVFLNHTRHIDLPVRISSFRYQS